MNNRLYSFSQTERLVSLDALRGFDMFMIAGAENMVRLSADYTSWAALNRIEAEFHHAEWNGFTFFDLIFPLFMFLTGVSFAFSLNKRLQQGDNLAALHVHVVQRGLLLVLLGMICNGLFLLEFDNLIFSSVLGRIGLGYILGALLAMHLKNFGKRLACCAAILLGYWALMTLIPVPGYGAGDLNPGHTLASYLDRLLLPGRLYAGDRDPNGLLATLPSTVNVIAGIIVGQLLLRQDQEDNRKVAILMLAGITSWALGQLWDGVFPINKRIWTSSFVMVTVGWSMILLAAFYLVIDVWKFRRWAFVFVVIGMNPLFIYIAQQFIAFRDIANLLLHDEHTKLHPLFVEFVMFAMKWFLLYYLYRKKIFFRV